MVECTLGRAGGCRGGIKHARQGKMASLYLEQLALCRVRRWHTGASRWGRGCRIVRVWCGGRETVLDVGGLT